MDDLSGQTIKGYELKERIGAGGFGAVYKGHETSVNRDVAIKVILPEHANNPEFTQRFETEAQLVAQLEHPHIIPLYSYWQDENGAFLVMRFVRGGSLRELIEKQGALPLKQIERWLDHLCQALFVAHNAGVVHRDLKPDNVLLDDLGNAYLTDFGIALKLDSPTNLTASDAIMGSWKYLSPEQIQNQPLSAQIDIYALGMMVYEMLSGEHPFSDTSATMLVMKHMQEPLPDICDIRTELPYEVNDVIQKATAKDPNDRYDSTEQFFTSFQDALKAEDSVPEPSQVIVEPPPKSQTQEERNRQAILQNVRNFWVEGVLENSLYAAVWIELGMAEKAEAVDNPWQTTLKVPDVADELLPSDTDILDVFDRLQGKVLILGEPGSGKTTTLLSLTRDLIRRAEYDRAHPIPVVFNLSSWAENRKPLDEWMVDELNLKYQVPKKVGKQWVDDEQILPLLDGLDEVAAAHRDACVEIINTYRSEHGFVDIVVCSRIADYEALTNKLRLNGAITLQPLQRHQVDEYLARAGDGLAGVRQILEDDEKLRRLTTSPLMLNILTLAYRDMDIDDIPRFDTLQGRRKHLFETYVDRMLERRGENMKYSPEKTKQYLGWLGNNMSRNAMSVFHIEHLQPAWLEKRSHRLRYGVYNSLTIVAIITISLLFLFLIAYVLIVLFPYRNALFSDFTTAPFFPIHRYSDRSLIDLAKSFLLVFALVNVFLTFIIYIPTLLINMGSAYWRIHKITIKPYTKTRWIWLKRSRSTILRLGVAVPIFLFFSLLAISSYFSEDSSAGFTICFSALAILFLLSGLGAEEKSDLIPMTTIPNEAFRKKRNWLTSLFRNHVALRYTLAHTELGPINYANFLDYVSERILMRKVGGGYIFIHRMLLEYFANLDEKDKPTEDDGRIARLSDYFDDDDSVDDIDLSSQNRHDSQNTL